MKKPVELGKFSEGFVFQLNGQEFENWKSRILTSNLLERVMRGVENE